MPFSFTLFDPKRKRIPKPIDPIVEVKASGRIFFNKQATPLLGKSQYCMLGYDAENKALGILPLSENQTSGIPVRYTFKGAYMGAKKALRHFGVLPPANLQNQPIQDGRYIAIKL
jgi:hypothetical protein